MKNIDIALMISLQLSGGGKTSKQYNETIQKQQEEIEYYRNKIQAMQQSLEEKKNRKATGGSRRDIRDRCEA